MPTINLIPNTQTQRNVVIFEDSPFFIRSLTLSIVPTAKSFSALPLNVSSQLVLGRDWLPAYYFNQASAEYAQPVYGGVYFVDPLLAGALTFQFDVVDNVYRASDLQRSSILENPQINPLFDWWENVVLGLPSVAHQDLIFDADQRVSFSDVANVLSLVQASSANTAAAKTIFDFISHLTADNPHADNAASVGLEKVPNWPTGDSASIIAGGSDREFVTPLAIRNAISSVVRLASVSQPGILALNIGTSPADATNSTDGLTAAGLIYLLQNNLLQSGASVIDAERQKITFTPNPIVYPAVWQGVSCNTFDDLVRAVETATGIANLTADASQACVYFPRAVSAPNLTLD